jgi:multidrug efflux pump subunit AcrA (membrane-fusion protein)
MSKIDNQSNSLYSIEFVRDISSEAAANYSGGADFFVDNTNDFANIVLHKDSDAQGQKLGIDSPGGEEVNIGLFPDGTETTFNDTVSSITVNEGRQTGAASYEVAIEPNNTVLGKENNQCSIQLGMEGQADIITREETALQFLLRKARLTTNL